MKVDLIEELELLLHNMLEFQELANDGENPHEELIFEFKTESLAFIEDALETEVKEDFLALVEIYVLLINRINEESDYELIETDEREQLYQFIVNVGLARGFEFNYDITEEYREW